jgi:hypothetical protein
MIIRVAFAGRGSGRRWYTGRTTVAPEVRGQSSLISLKTETILSITTLPITGAGYTAKLFSARFSQAQHVCCTFSQKRLPYYEAYNIERAPPKYWNNVANQRHFFEFARTKLNIQHMDDWYAVSKQSLQKLGGSILFTTMVF